MPALMSREQFRQHAREHDSFDGHTAKLLHDSLESATLDVAIEVPGNLRARRFIFSDGSVDRMGDTIDPRGWQLGSFLKNPIALFAHDSSTPENVMGTATNVGPVGDKLVGDIVFASADVNPNADAVFKLVTAGILRACSVGFIPIDFAWSQDKARPYGIDFKKQELVEISVCPVPANANALADMKALIEEMGAADPLLEWLDRINGMRGFVSAPRSHLERLYRAAKTPSKQRLYLQPKADASSWKCAASRDLPLDEGEGWDGPAAAGRMLNAAGFDGDSPDSGSARRGFLAYDSANPALRGSYKLPFADIVGGTLKAVEGGIRAAASRLPQTDIPADVEVAARAVLDAYEARMTDPEDQAEKALRLKVGAKISAANAALLQQAMDHHASATDCIKSVLGNSDGGNETDGDTNETGGSDSLGDACILGTCPMNTGTKAAGGACPMGADCPMGLGGKPMDPAMIHDPVVDAGKSDEDERLRRIARVLALTADI